MEKLSERLQKVGQKKTGTLESEKEKLVRGKLCF